MPSLEDIASSRFGGFVKDDVDLWEMLELLLGLAVLVSQLDGRVGVWILRLSKGLRVLAFPAL